MSTLRHDPLLCLPNRIEVGTLVAAEAADYQTAWPLANSELTERAKVTRTADVDTANTKFGVDLGSLRNVITLQVVGHNFTEAAQIRVRAGSTQWAFDVYDSGWVGAWQLTALFAEMAAMGVEAASVDHSRYLVGRCFGNFLNTRYLSFEVDDDANPAGYLQWSRVFVGGAFIPQRGIRPGLTSPIRDFSTAASGVNGATWTTRRGQQRSRAFSLVLEDRETMLVDELRASIGTAQEVLWLASRGDPIVAQQGSFIGRLEEVGPIEYPAQTVQSLALRVTEWL